MPQVIYGLGGEHTHTTSHAYMNESDFKKSGTRWQPACT